MSSNGSNEKYDEDEQASEENDQSQVTATTLVETAQQQPGHQQLDDDEKTRSQTTATSDLEESHIPAVKSVDITKSVTLSDVKPLPTLVSEKMVMDDEDDVDDDHDDVEKQVQMVPPIKPPLLATPLLAATDEKASYRELYDTQPSLAPSIDLERKLPAKAKSNIDDEKAIYRMDREVPSMQPSISFQRPQLPPIASSRSENDNDEKAAYRPAPALAMAPSMLTSNLFGPSIASGTESSHDMALSKTSFDGLSVAQGRHDLVTADELFAAEIATESAGADAKESGKSFKGGVATISPGRGQRVPRATAPGVEYIRRRAPGMRPSWYSERLSRSSLFDSQQPSEQSLGNVIPPAVPTRRLPAVAEVSWSMPKLRENRRGCYIIWAILACAVVGIAVGVGYGVAANKGGASSSGRSSQLSQFAHYSHDCNSLLDNPTNPHVLTQCYCNHTISMVPKDIAARYDVLSQSFIPTVDPMFHERMDSCSPENQALVWLASGDGSTSTTSSTALLQRYQMALLFILWNGTSWGGNDGWLSVNDECTWLGITCNGQSEVNSMLLQNQNITGSLPLDAAWLLLTSLTELDLSQNQIQSIQLNTHTLLGNQSSLLVNSTVGGSMLTSLDLSYNAIGETLPVALSNLTALRKLRLGWNNLHGTIPTQLGLLTNLVTVDLSKNNFTGQIPSEIGQWHVVETITMDTNNFTTTLPTEMGSLLNLTMLQMYSSGVHGSLPKELFHTTSMLLQLDLSGNFLTGTIPTEVGNAFELGKLYLANLPGSYVQLVIYVHKHTYVFVYYARFLMQCFGLHQTTI